ncbi:MAG: hypothetical protein ABGZ17_27625 [Planctomycetaceae bacterium]
MFLAFTCLYFGVIDVQCQSRAKRHASVFTLLSVVTAQAGVPTVQDFENLDGRFQFAI